MSTQNQLQFVPFSSTLEPGFWHQLAKKKLEVFQLDQKPVAVNGFYSNEGPVGLPPLATVDYTAFDEPWQAPPRNFTLEGILLNTNTLEDFKNKDKKTLIQCEGDKIWDDIVSGEALNCPSLLSKFLCLTFSDLKSYHFYYWFAFPAVCYPNEVYLIERQPITNVFSGDQLTLLKEAFLSSSAAERLFSLVFVTEDGTPEIHPLRSYPSLKTGRVLLAFADPSTTENYPGWPLRNLLALVAHAWGKERKEWEFICYRERSKEGTISNANSLIFKVRLPDDLDAAESVPCVGWEKNEKQKMGPRFVNLSSTMDPQRLAESAVDLNLKLMKWRLVPFLDLEKISSTRCLLLGAGTLGCNVARSLLGWGIRKISFVDGGNVSYSNPVRQSLFTFEDCLDGGKPKAKAAAEQLKRIMPSSEATGYSLPIPMPGHPVHENMLEKTQSEVEKLEKLIEEHDVIFLLTDTRESRWLPTLISASKRKIVINAALGFDTFLVMRHGLKVDLSCGDVASSAGNFVPGECLGCYFCNDVVAPGNSTKDRTLDQQCTVTRPGVSMMAGALAVELMVNLLQHPLGATAAASVSSDDILTMDSESELGLVPHQIRGFMARFHHIMPATSAFGRCTACSPTVIEQYQKEGFPFLLKVFSDPIFLEDLTGLKQLHEETDMAEIWELDDSDTE